MDCGYMKTVCQWFMLMFVAGVFVNAGDAIQNDLVETSDAIIWATKGIKSFPVFTPDGLRFGLAYVVSAYTSPLVTQQTNYSIRPTLLLKEQWFGEVWTMFADYHANRLYYTNHEANYIAVYDLKTKQEKTVFNGQAFGLDSIGVDWISGNLYWTDTYLNCITVANRNFSHYKNIVSINSRVPAKIAVHPIAGFLYWSERHNNTCLIYRSDLQGRDRTLLQNRTSAGSITALSIDYAEDRLYWSEILKSISTSSAIRYCDLKSANPPANLVVNTSSYVESFVYYKGYLYVTEHAEKRIFVINAESGEVITEKRFLFLTHPWAITLFADPYYFTNATVKDICAKSNCQHLCIANHKSDSYTCHCSIGFQLQSDDKSCASAMLYDDFALVVDTRSSKVYQLSMTSPETPQRVTIKTIDRPTSIEYDWNTQTVVWADDLTDTISTYSLKNKTEMVILNRTQADSIALDVLSGNLYFVNSQAAAIFVANLEGKYIHTLHVDHIWNVAAMAIDPVRGYIYWSDWGQSDFDLGSKITGTIRSSRLDGSDVQTISNSTSQPTGLAISQKGNILFWTQSLGYSISWINFDDGTRGEYELPPLNINQDPTDLAFWRDRLYYTDAYNNHVLSVSVENVMKNVKGSKDQIETFGPALFFDANSLHIYSSAAVGKGSDVCQNSKCPHLCLPQHVNNTVKAKCVCQDHFTYFESNNTCVQTSSTNDTLPPTFNGTCPRSRTIVLTDCIDRARIDFTIPTAIDDSGAPVTVKSMIKIPKMPMLREEGAYVFHFVATDKSHNKAQCRFILRVLAMRCFPIWAFPFFKYSTFGKPSCQNRVGSQINATCNHAPETVYQYKCLTSGQWDNPFSTINCPRSAPTTPIVGKETSAFLTSKAVTSGAVATIQNNNVHLSTAKMLQGQKGAPQSSNSGLIAGVVIGVLIVVIAVVALFVLQKRRGIRFVPLTSNWRRSDDRVYLTENDDDKVVF